MNLIRNIVDILLGRLIASVGAVFASRLETLATLEHAEQQNELEERARRFEDEGKAHLAAALRSQAAEITTNNPGCAGHNVIRQLQEEHVQLGDPRIGQASAEEANTGIPPEESEPKGRRPAKRRTCRRTNPNSPSTS